MRNPVTKTGRTSNTTGSRIRTSARTIREKTGNLVQNARKKVSMSSPALGYKHATSPRAVPGSAAAAGEKARKRSYNQGQTTRQGRSAAYSAIKTAKAPSDAPLGYKAGYAVGARVAGSTYKQNVLTKTGTSRPYSHIQGGSYQVSAGRTGLESRLQTAAKAAGIQTRRFAGNLLRNKPVQPAHIQRPVSNAPLVDRNRVASALSSLKSAGSRFATGVRTGYRMPDASVRQTYNAQRFSTSASFPGHAPVTLASRGNAGSFAAGYGVGKSAKVLQNFALGVGTGYKYSNITKQQAVAYGSKSAAGHAVGRLAAAPKNVTFGIQNALKGVGRGFKYAAQGNIQNARSAANAAYRGDSMADRLASRIVNPIERGMQRLAPVATRIGKLNARVVEAAVPGFTSNPLSATARRIAQPVRYAQRKANERSARIAAEAARQQRIQTATPWGPKGSVTPTGKNAVVMQQRYQAAVLGNSASNMGVMGPPRPSKFYRQQAKPSATPTAQPQAKTPWGGRSVNWASYQPQSQAATRPVTPTGQKQKKTRMPSGKQYGSKITPGQPHSMRATGAASTATPPPNPAPPKKTPKDVLAETQKSIRYTASNIRKQMDHWENTKGFEGFAQEQESRLKALIGVARKAQKDMRPDNAAELAAAGASRTADVVARARKNFGPQQPSKVFAKPPTTGDQTSLLPEEPQPRGRGKRGKDRKPRQPRGQAGK